jgi:hypothetical protein
VKAVEWEAIYWCLEESCIGAAVAKDHEGRDTATFAAKTSSVSTGEYQAGAGGGGGGGGGSQIKQP